VDLNELLYAHQLAVMNANAPHASLEGRENNLETASNYADKIRLMPGSLDISRSANPGDAASSSLNSGATDERPASRANKPAVLSAWENEGGAVASP
jgi:hypothetical protein